EISPISEVLRTYREEVKKASHNTLKISVERNRGFNYCFSLEMYFRTHREGHNLDRARTQIKLVSDMEAQFDEMKKIISDSFQG
ncbi:MAG: hypothetical protein J6Z34_06380, partial [Clostridia bacterium]|nr:hypothetical protein [Clostridia bacterium]